MADTLNDQTPGTGSEPPLYAPESGFSLFLKLFIVPAGIVAIALGIFLLGTVALQHPKTAAQYLEELKSDSTNRRWQAAFELSRMLNQGEDIQFDEKLRADLVKTFAEAKSDDPKVRQYLALVLGHLKEKSAVAVLSDAAHDGSSEVRVYSLWALGNISDPAGGPAALQALSDNDPEVQHMAVGALSAIRYAPAKQALEGELSSPTQAIRFDSAVALARLKDKMAIPTLLEMMEMKPNDKPDEKKEDISQSAKLAAIEGAKELSDEQLHQKLVSLSKNDPDLKVKDAALQALKNK
jgi:HEAT repeat protein